MSRVRPDEHSTTAIQTDQSAVARVRCEEMDMAPLIVLLVSWLVVRAVGFGASWHEADSWSGALRFAFAIMFLFTAASHFHPRTRGDLIRKVPERLPAPGVLVTATGLFELIGAVGLLVPPAATAAAYGLMLLLVAMFPANVHAARARLMVVGRQASPLVWRLPLQIFWIASLWWVARTSA
jgi:uncharacterized membrane protein